MEQTYIVELTLRDCLWLSSVLDNIRNAPLTHRLEGADQAHVERIAEALHSRNAKPVQPSAWERLEEWFAEYGGSFTIEKCVDITSGREYTRVELSWQWGVIVREGVTHLDAINAALDAARQAAERGTDHEPVVRGEEGVH